MDSYNLVALFFGKMRVSGTYNIVGPPPIDVIAPNQCGIEIGYGKTGQVLCSVSGGSVTVTNKKIFAFFNNVNMSIVTAYSTNTLHISNVWYGFGYC